jgi:hypothetical protein
MTKLLNHNGKPIKTLDRHYLTKETLKRTTDKMLERGDEILSIRKTKNKYGYFMRIKFTSK